MKMRKPLDIAESHKADNEQRKPDAHDAYAVIPLI